MGYVIAIVLVLLIVAAFVGFLVVNSTRRNPSASPDDPGAEKNPLGIISSDGAPAGDTDQHAGDQREGETVADPESGGGATGGAGGPGGGERREAPTPESERLADRPF